MRVASSLLAFTALVSPAYADDINVATDIRPVAALIEMVGGDHVNVTSLVRPTDDAHNISLRPSQARALSQANYVAGIGEELTLWFVESVASLNPDAPARYFIDVEGTTLIEPGEDGHDDHDDHDDHEKHDDHDHHDHSVDPHAWMHGNNAAVWIDQIVKDLSAISPENHEEFEVNAKAAVAELDQLYADLGAQFADQGEISFATSHYAIAYFEQWLDIDTHIVQIETKAKQLAPAARAEAEAEMKEHGSKCILLTAVDRTGALENLATDAGVPVVEISVLGRSNTTSYIDIMKELATDVISCR